MLEIGRIQLRGRCVLGYFISHTYSVGGGCGPIDKEVYYDVRSIVGPTLLNIDIRQDGRVTELPRRLSA